MRYLHIFTEEASAKNLFESIIPQIIPEDVYYRIYPHQGKQDLEKALSSVIPSISRTPGALILVTRDQDQSDCVAIKEQFNQIMINKCSCPYKIRIICKELEAWFLGDLEAIKKAYPRFNPDAYINKAELRNVDAISNPNRLLLRMIPEYNDRETLPKLESSESISKHLNLQSNRSSSFNQTLNGISELLKIS